MRKIILLLLWVLPLAACSTQTPIRSPVLPLSSDYQGLYFEEGRSKGKLYLDVKQDGSKVSGQYCFVDSEAIFGKFEGTTQGKELKLSLKVPLTYIREHSMSPTIELQLKSSACSKDEAKDLLRRLKLKKANASEKLEGRIQFTAYQEAQDYEIALIDAPPATNIFNK